MGGEASMWQQLADVISSLTDAYGRLTEAGKAKRDALVAVDMARIDELVKSEQAIVEEIEKLEASRRKALSAISAHEPYIGESSSSGEVISKCPDELRGKMKSVNDALREKVKAARRIEMDNGFLASTALGAVRYNLNRIGGAAVEPGYGGSGEEIVTREKKFDFEA